MKKIIFSFLLMICFISNVKAQNVTLYLFRGNTCPHCEEALKYINNHKEEIPENVTFLTYEVYKNKENSKLLDEVGKKVNVPEKDQGSIPFFIVGDSYYVGYSGAADFKKVIEFALAEAEAEDYKDVVKETIKDKELNVKSMTIEQVFPEPNPVVTIVVYSVFGIIVLGFGAMILFSRKN